MARVAQLYHRRPCFLWYGAASLLLAQDVGLRFFGVPRWKVVHRQATDLGEGVGDAWRRRSFLHEQVLEILVATFPREVQIWRFHRDPQAKAEFLEIS